MPDEIQKLMANKEVSRKDKTKLVNETVSRDAQGHWVLNLQNPTLQGLSEQYTTLSGKEKAKGYPRSMIVSKVGGAVALQAAIQRGEIRVVHEKGLEYYMFNTIEIAKATENPGSKLPWAGRGAPGAVTDGSHGRLLRKLQPAVQ